MHLSGLFLLFEFSSGDHPSHKWVPIVDVLIYMGLIHLLRQILDHSPSQTFCQVVAWVMLKLYKKSHNGLKAILLIYI